MWCSPLFEVGGRQPPETSVKRLECAEYSHWMRNGWCLVGSSGFQLCWRVSARFRKVAQKTRLYGYGSIPINTIYRGMNIHKSQLFWCELQGYQGFDPLPYDYMVFESGVFGPQISLKIGILIRELIINQWIWGCQFSEKARHIAHYVLCLQEILAHTEGENDFSWYWMYPAALFACRLSPATRYIIAGPPLEQISIAEPLAAIGETCLSPQVRSCSEAIHRCDDFVYIVLYNYDIEHHWHTIILGSICIIGITYYYITLYDFPIM